ncbi:hypothetical protein B484DRAFT_409946, partial [Ochromonadaceae sp. CCMP2298]
MFAEATPFYLASREACSRIAEHLPGAKLVVLLREPVARAYSEYQMKKRRIEHQDEFLRLIERYAAELLYCMEESGPDFDRIRRCTPPPVRRHGRWSKLVNAWRRGLQATDWNSVVSGCFPGRTADPLSTEGDILAPAARYLNLTARPLLRLSLDAYSDYPFYADSQEADEACLAMGAGSGYRFRLSRHSLHCHRQSLRRPFLRNSSSRVDSETAVPPLGAFGDLGEGESLPTVDPRWVVKFDALSCWSHAREGYEHLNGLRAAFIGEVQAFKTCAGELWENATRLGPTANGTATATRVDVEQETDTKTEQEQEEQGVREIHTADVETALQLLNQAVDKCLRVRTGISTHYFYRSMFAVQLQHCFRSIPREQVLILASGRLRTHPQQVLDEVLAFVGLPTAPTPTPTPTPAATATSTPTPSAT